MQGLSYHRLFSGEVVLRSAQMGLNSYLNDCSVHRPYTIYPSPNRNNLACFGLSWLANSSGCLGAITLASGYLDQPGVWMPH